MSGFWERVVGVPASAPATPVPQPPPGKLDQGESQATKAQSARSAAHCPSCGSGNFMAPPTAPEHPRCFECGYPKLHSTSGLIASSSDGPAKPARVQSQSSPSINNIVNRIG